MRMTWRLSTFTAVGPHQRFRRKFVLRTPRQTVDRDSELAKTGRAPPELFRRAVDVLRRAEARLAARGDCRSPDSW